MFLRNTLSLALTNCSFIIKFIHIQSIKFNKRGEAPKTSQDMKTRFLKLQEQKRCPAYSLIGKAGHLFILTSNHYLFFTKHTSFIFP